MKTLRRAPFSNDCVITLVRFNLAEREGRDPFEVRVYRAGRIVDAETYYANDEADAVGTHAAMVDAELARIAERDLVSMRFAAAERIAASFRFPTFLRHSCECCQ